MPGTTVQDGIGVGGGDGTGFGHGGKGGNRAKTTPEVAPSLPGVYPSMARCIQHVQLSPLHHVSVHAAQGPGPPAVALAFWQLWQHAASELAGTLQLFGVLKSVWLNSPHLPPQTVPSHALNGGPGGATPGGLGTKPPVALSTAICAGGITTATSVMAPAGTNTRSNPTSCRVGVLTTPMAPGPGASCHEAYTCTTSSLSTVPTLLTLTRTDTLPHGVTEVGVTETSP